MSTCTATRSTARGSPIAIDDSIGAPASGIAIGASCDGNIVHSPRGAAMHSPAPRMPRDVMALQIVENSAPPRSTMSASIIFCATSLNVGSGGMPKHDSITSVSVVCLPAFRKISRSAEDQISEFSYSTPVCGEAM